MNRKVAIAERRTYLREAVNLLLAQWPNNRTVNNHRGHELVTRELKRWFAIP